MYLCHLQKCLLNVEVLFSSHRRAQVKQPFPIPKDKCTSCLAYIALWSESNHIRQPLGQYRQNGGKDDLHINSFSRCIILTFLCLKVFWVFFFFFLFFLIILDASSYVWHCAGMIAWPLWNKLNQFEGWANKRGFSIRTPNSKVSVSGNSLIQHFCVYSLTLASTIGFREVCLTNALNF